MNARYLIRLSAAALTMISVNAANFFSYGLKAPRYGERIWVEPAALKKRLKNETRREIFGTSRPASGRVIGGDWDRHVQPKLHGRKLDHWAGGIPWEETGIFEMKMAKIRRKGSSAGGCRSLEQVRERYRRLDEVFRQAREEGRFRTQEELSGRRRFFAPGEGEIEVYIDRHGNPIHGYGGNHRLAIAIVLKLPIVPAKIGVVHPEGVKHLHRYRLSEEQVNEIINSARRERSR